MPTTNLGSMRQASRRNRDGSARAKQRFACLPLAKWLRPLDPLQSAPGGEP